MGGGTRPVGGGGTGVDEGGTGGGDGSGKEGRKCCLRRRAISARESSKVMRRMASGLDERGDAVGKEDWCCILVDEAAVLNEGKLTSSCGAFADFAVFVREKKDGTGDRVLVNDMERRRTTLHNFVRDDGAREDWDSLEPLTLRLRGRIIWR